MKSTSFIASLLIFSIAFMATASAFTSPAAMSTTFTRTAKSQINMVFSDDKEREVLTRESEPEEYFQTNTDKMSDADKLPIALAGVGFIALPFLAGLVALYAAQ